MGGLSFRGPLFLYPCCHSGPPLFLHPCSHSGAPLPTSLLSFRAPLFLHPCCHSGALFLHPCCHSGGPLPTSLLSFRGPLFLHPCCHSGGPSFYIPAVIQAPLPTSLLSFKAPLFLHHFCHYCLKQWRVYCLSFMVEAAIYSALNNRICVLLASNVTKIVFAHYSSWKNFYPIKYHRVDSESASKNTSNRVIFVTSWPLHKNLTKFGRAI